jgi:hypothetical protein
MVIPISRGGSIGKLNISYMIATALKYICGLKSISIGRGGSVDIFNLM